ncbi:MAG: M20/M25/M40 family metallo-hydrolase [Myxococcales bacterium]|nr:M20/M25/M40 family metallo-hydrolase [Myxococcales bacterium]
MTHSGLGAALARAVDDRFEAAQVPWLQRVVDQPSHTAAKADVEAAAAIVDELAASLGLTCERVADETGKFADHRVYATPATGADDRAIALVGHIDTVFPRKLGFLAFSRDDDAIRGPGVLDMKSGISEVLFALDALRRAAPEVYASLKARVIIVSDEEVGSPSSHALYERLAPRTTAGLVFESGRKQDRIVTARKGGGVYTITAHGKAAHAGVNHAAGVNAIHALALIVARIEGMTDYGRGVTLNVGLFEGGTAKNTVPERASIQVDARYQTMADAERVTAALFALADDPFAGIDAAPERLRGVRVEVSGGLTRPPMEPLPATAALRLAYEPYAAAQGLQVGEAPLQGGGSDANLLVALGVPCIDGLGPFGEFFHEVHEWSSLSSLRRRTAALAWFLAEQSAREWA